MVGITLLLLTVYIVVALIDKLVKHKGGDDTFRNWYVDCIRNHHVLSVTSQETNCSEIGSKALRADGSCSIVCAYMTWTVLAGAVLNAMFGWWWIDSIAALALMYFVLKKVGKRFKKRVERKMRVVVATKNPI